MLVSLSRFYSVKNNMLCVLPYISGELPHVSLRMIDWFVTNYSKKHNVVLARENGAANAIRTVVHFNVYLNYRSQLKAYSKQQFDPFRRRDRIMFRYSSGSDAVETTVGQLNFFRWMLQNGLLEYVDRNAEAIDKDMVSCQREPTTTTGGEEEDVVDPPRPRRDRQVNKDVRSARSEMSNACSAARTMTRVAGAMTVAFE